MVFRRRTRPGALLWCAPWLVLGGGLRAEIPSVSWRLALQAQEAIPTALNDQVTVMLKALEYDRNLGKRTGPIRIAVLFVPGHAHSQGVKDQIMAILASGPTVSGRPVAPRELAYTTAIELARIARTEAFTAFYLAPGMADHVADVVQVSRDQKVLTVTGVPDYLKRGVALTFLMYGEVTKPYLGRTAATAEGSKFEADFIIHCKLG
jgi:hypothetical protein